MKIALLFLLSFIYISAFAELRESTVEIGNASLNIVQRGKDLVSITEESMNIRWQLLQKSGLPHCLLIEDRTTDGKEIVLLLGQNWEVAEGFIREASESFRPLSKDQLSAYDNYISHFRGVVDEGLKGLLDEFEDE